MPAAMRISSRSFVFALASVLLAPIVARAQVTGVTNAGSTGCVAAAGPDTGVARAGAPLQPTRRDSARAEAQPAVVLLAAVQADEVRFDKQPRICVTLVGDVQLDSVRVTG